MSVRPNGHACPVPHRLQMVLTLEVVECEMKGARLFELKPATQCQIVYPSNFSILCSVIFAALELM
jgi:hypothetical protein